MAQQRKGQTGEPTTNRGHFGSRQRPEGSISESDLERLKDANSFGGTEEFNRIQDELEAQHEASLERAAEAYRHGEDDDDEEAAEIFCFQCGEQMVVDDNGVSNHVDEDGDIDHDSDDNHVPYADLDSDEPVDEAAEYEAATASFLRIGFGTYTPR